jgi:hypothetical protein
VRGKRKRGDKALGLAGRRNVRVRVGVGLRDRRKVGETTWSKTESGEAGRRGEARGKRAERSRGGIRKGFRGECGLSGDIGECACFGETRVRSGDGVSGSQYDSGGTGGVGVAWLAKSRDVDVVPGRGNVARRGVGGRAARHERFGGVEMVSEVGLGRAEAMASWVGMMVCRSVLSGASLSVLGRKLYMLDNACVTSTTRLGSETWKLNS